jgi:large subunit ribosomal protein L37Ae
MSRNLKKIGSSGRFGARYGIRARKRIAGIEKGQRKRHSCPQCNHEAVKRVSSGIWMCRHCDLKFAGGAYRPRTEARRRSSLSFTRDTTEDMESEPGFGSEKTETELEEPGKPGESEEFQETEKSQESGDSEESEESEE